MATNASQDNGFQTSIEKILEHAKVSISATDPRLKFVASMYSSLQNALYDLHTPEYPNTNPALVAPMLGLEYKDDKAILDTGLQGKTYGVIFAAFETYVDTNVRLKISDMATMLTEKYASPGKKLGDDFMQLVCVFLGGYLTDPIDELKYEDFAPIAGGLVHAGWALNKFRTAGTELSLANWAVFDTTTTESVADATNQGYFKFWSELDPIDKAKDLIPFFAMRYIINQIGFRFRFSKLVTINLWTTLEQIRQITKSYVTPDKVPDAVTATLQAQTPSTKASTLPPLPRGGGRCIKHPKAEKSKVKKKKKTVK